MFETLYSSGLPHKFYFVTSYFSFFNPVAVYMQRHKNQGEEWNWAEAKKNVLDLLMENFLKRTRRMDWLIGSHSEGHAIFFPTLLILIKSVNLKAFWDILDGLRNYSNE